MARSPKNAPAHAITDAYMDRLALDLDDRLLDGATLTEALEDLLRDEAPVTFYDPSDPSSSGSTLLKTLLGLGLAAAAGYGLNALLKQQTGKSAAQFAREQTGQQPASSDATVYASPVLHDDPEEGFRAHHRATYGETGRDFAHYEPAYRHAHAYGANEQYHEQSYDALEPEIRRTYEAEHGADTFGEVRGATRHAFERGRAQHASAPVGSPRAGSTGSAGAASGDASPASREGSFEAHLEDFRSHYHNAYNDTDRAFDDYTPAYRLGFRYGTDDERRTREFEALEPEMRRAYEKEHGEDAFTSVEGAARHAFHRARTVRAQA